MIGKMTVINDLNALCSNMPYRGLFFFELDISLSLLSFANATFLTAATAKIHHKSNAVLQKSLR